MCGSAASVLNPNYCTIEAPFPSPMHFPGTQVDERTRLRLERRHPWPGKPSLTPECLLHHPWIPVAYSDLEDPLGTRPTLPESPTPTQHRSFIPSVQHFAWLIRHLRTQRCDHHTNVELRKSGRRLFAFRVPRNTNQFGVLPVGGFCQLFIGFANRSYNHILTVKKRAVRVYLF